MSTLIALYSGGLVGRCDTRCYEAIHPDCDCICGGCNHGVGREQAVQHTRHMAQEWIVTYTQQKGVSTYRTHIPAECQQLSLWKME